MFFKYSCKIYLSQKGLGNNRNMFFIIFYPTSFFSKTCILLHFYYAIKCLTSAKWPNQNTEWQGEHLIMSPILFKTWMESNINFLKNIVTHKKYGHFWVVKKTTCIFKLYHIIWTLKKSPHIGKYNDLRISNQDTKFHHRTSCCCQDKRQWGSACLH